MLLCVLILGIGGFYIAINTVTPPSARAPAPVSTPAPVEEPAPARALSIRYSLTTSVIPPGSGSISPSSGTYDSGTQVTLTATPSSYWKFDHWSGADDNSVNPTTVTMTGPKNVTAYFVAPALAAPNLVTPSNGATGIELRPRFLWKAVLGAKGYDLVVSPNSDFSDIVISVSMGDTAYQLPPDLRYYQTWEDDTLTPSTRYYWLVAAAVNPADLNTPVAYSEVWSFTTAPAPVNKVYQRIEYTMPWGALSGSSTSYTKWLEPGEKVDGFIELTGKYYSTDWSYKWHFQVLGPGGESVHDWEGHWVNTPHHDFNFTPSYAGEYTIRVSHASSYAKNLVIEIWPPGWN